VIRTSELRNAYLTLFSRVLKDQDSVGGGLDLQVPLPIDAIATHEQRSAQLRGEPKAGLDKSPQMERIAGQMPELTESVDEDAPRPGRFNPIRDEQRYRIFLDLSRRKQIVHLHFTKCGGLRRHV